MQEKEKVILNKLMDYELETSKFERIVAIQRSHSTNSKYTLFVDDEGKLFELAISDHSSPVRYKELNDFMFDNDLEEDDMEEFIKLFGTANDVMLPSEYYYYLITVGDTVKYNEHENVASYIGRRSLDRAIVSDYYTVINAEVIEDNRILKTTYNNGEIEYYPTEYCPFIANEDDKMFDDVEMLKDHGFSPQDIRRFIFKDNYFALDEKDMVEMLRDEMDQCTDDDKEDCQRMLDNAIETSDFQEIYNFFFEDDMTIEFSELCKTNHGNIAVGKYKKVRF